MKRNIILGLVILSISVGLKGQMFQMRHYNLNIFEPEIIDARAEALGKTSILSSTGANFIFNNPAMLSNLKSKNIQISCRSIFGKDEIKSEYDDETNKTEIEYKFHFKLNGLSFSMPYDLFHNKDIKFSLGAGYRTYYDWGYNKHSRSSEEYSDDDYDLNSHGGLNVIVLGGGLNNKEKLYGGFSISVPFLSDISSEYEDNEGKDKSEGSMNGSFFTLSGAYILNEKITLGVRLRTGYELSIAVYGGDFEIPSEFGLAVEYKPKTNLKLYAEYLTRGLGDYEIQTFMGNMDLYYFSDNGFALRTGLEAGKNDIFRAGFFIQSVPIYKLKSNEDGDSDYDENPLTEMGFTAGFGMKFNANSYLDLFGIYSFLQYDDKYDDYYWREQFSDEYFYSRIKIGCSLGYNF